jgi:hypothetical protein
MAITAGAGQERGRPTSWSAAVDALAAGLSFVSSTSGLEFLGKDAPRLFLISAGNAPIDPASDPIDASDSACVRDPAQAWNAVSVGAYTDKDALGDDKSYEGWRTMAAPGELSPHSTTSLGFEGQWPVKPDVVFEGGNVAVSPDRRNAEPQMPSLCVLTTNWKPSDRLFTTSNATSAATAQVAHIAGQILAERSDFWPETVRGLLVHSAEWTSAMKMRFDRTTGKRERVKLFRRYGHGVPSAERAIRSSADALTLIVQSEICPYRDGKMREMHILELPWPEAVLRELEEAEVELRVTLSYFIEPNPACRGWKGRYQYASHGLRFDIRRAEESIPEFERRLNLRARSEEAEDTGGAPSDDGWLLGENARRRGSLLQDTWRGTAADLASRGVVGVYPVGGWWKDKRKPNRSGARARYSLIVSIRTEREDVDVWTPVAALIGLPIDIAT